MRGTQSHAGVAVKVLVERDEVTPALVLLEEFVLPVYRSAPITVEKEDADESSSNIVGHLAKGALLPRPGRVLDAEIVAEEVVVAPQPLDDEVVHREPHWSPPIGVAAEQAGGGLPRLVADCEVGTGQVDGERVLQVRSRQCTNSVRREELGRVEHAGQDVH